MIARLRRFFPPGRFAPTILFLGITSVSHAFTLQDDFSALQPGPLTPSWLEERWNTRADNGVRENRVFVLQEDGNTFLRIRYPEGQNGSRLSGASWRAPLPPSDEAVAEYRVRFEPGFDWTKGGKLPGLTGGSGPSGGRPRPDGFTARYMWHPAGALILYLYHSEQKGRYGDGLRLAPAGSLEPSRWHILKQRIRLNTPGEPDGLLHVWLDGRLVLDRSDLRWRLAGDSWQIDQFYFSTFHGGSGPAYQPNRDNHIDFDDFVITTTNPPSQPASSSGQNDHTAPTTPIPVL